MTEQQAQAIIERLDRIIALLEQVVSPPPVTITLPDGSTTLVEAIGKSLNAGDIER